VLLATTVAVAIWQVSSILNPGPDWHTFYEASHYLVNGQSPYLQKAFANPPWALVPALPLALLLPEHLGRAAWLFLSFAGFALVAYRLGAKPLSLGVFLGAPTTVHCLLNGNIDWLPLLGFTFAPQIGLLFVVIKPQIGVGIAMFWLVEAYRQGGLKQLFQLTYPTTVAYLLSFLLYGLWPLSMATVFENSVQWNASFWPYSIPVGLALIGIGLYRRQQIWTYGAGPCLSPYTLFHIWNAVLVSLLSKPGLLLALVTILWLAVWVQI
jgi:hypothetical protein